MRGIREKRVWFCEKISKWRSSIEFPHYIHARFPIIPSSHFTPLQWNTAVPRLTNTRLLEEQVNLNQDTGIEIAVNFFVSSIRITLPNHANSHFTHFKLNIPRPVQVDSEARRSNGEQHNSEFRNSLLPNERRVGSHVTSKMPTIKVEVWRKNREAVLLLVLLFFLHDTS